MTVYPEVDRRNEVKYGCKREPFIDAALVSAVQTVFQRSRLAHQNWRSYQASGRLDSRTLWRWSAHRSTDIFKERRNPSTTKLNVWLLVDASGSMSGPNACRAQDLCGTMVEAFKRIPSVKLHIWQHSLPVGGTTRMTRVYESGVNKVNMMLANIGNGNADGFALKWLGARALREQRQDERTLIIVLSDGAPTDHGMGATRKDLVAFSRAVSDELRQQGVGVMAVGITRTANSESARMYGAEHTIMFHHGQPEAWGELARGFGAIFGKLMA